VAVWGARAPRALAIAPSRSRTLSEDLTTDYADPALEAAQIGFTNQEWNFRISREALWSAATWRRFVKSISAALIQSFFSN
jgi:hypothetical protein